MEIGDHHSNLYFGGIRIWCFSETIPEDFVARKFFSVPVPVVLQSCLVNNHINFGPFFGNFQPFYPGRKFHGEKLFGKQVRRLNI